MSPHAVPPRVIRDGTAQLMLVRRYAKLLRETAAATSVRRAGPPRPPIRPSAREQDRA